jgi:hypothetical protein
MKMDMPIVHDCSPTTMFSKDLAQELWCDASFLEQLPIESWRELKLLVDYADEPSFSEWYSKVSNTLHVISESLKVNKSIRTYAKCVRDYVNLKRSYLAEHWKKKLQIAYFSKAHLSLLQVRHKAHEV